jgi:hypothetical protein
MACTRIGSITVSVCSDLRKGPVTLIVTEPVVFGRTVHARPGDEEIEIAVIVTVAPRASPEVTRVGGDVALQNTGRGDLGAGRTQRSGQYQNQREA